MKKLIDWLFGSPATTLPVLSQPLPEINAEQEESVPQSINESKENLQPNQNILHGSFLDLIDTTLQFVKRKPFHLHGSKLSMYDLQYIQSLMRAKTLILNNQQLDLAITEELTSFCHEISFQYVSDTTLQA